MALVHLNFFLRLALLGMIWNDALSPDVCANPLSIIALVGNHDGAPFETNEQCLGANDVMDLAQKDQEADRAALRLDPSVDFRREASLVSVDTTISTLFDARGVLMNAPDRAVDHCLSPLDLRLHPGAPSAPVQLFDPRPWELVAAPYVGPPPPLLFFGPFASATLVRTRAIEPQRAQAINLFMSIPSPFCSVKSHASTFFEAELRQFYQYILLLITWGRSIM
jgi:hypothetical protein